MRLILPADSVSCCVVCLGLALSGCSEPEPPPLPEPVVQQDPDLAWDLLAIAPALAAEPELRRLAFFRMAGDPFGPFLGADGATYDLGFNFYQREMTAAHLLADDYVGIEGDGWIETGPVAKTTITPIVYHGSKLTDPPRLEARLVTANDLGGSVDLYARPRQVRWDAGRIVEQAPIVLATPQLRGSAGAVVLELRDAEDKLLAANLVPILIRENPPPAPRVERQHALRVLSRAAAPPAPAARFDLSFEIPEAVFAAKIKGVEILVELASIAPGGKLLPTLAGQPLGALEIPEAVSGAGAMLSRMAGERPALHGALLRFPVKVDDELISALRANPTLTLDAVGGPALRLFGETSGRYPLDPTLIFDTEEAVELTE